MSKGSKRRPALVSRETWENNFEAIFGKKQSEEVSTEEVDEETPRPVVQQE